MSRALQELLTFGPSRTPRRAPKMTTEQRSAIAKATAGTMADANRVRTEMPDYDRASYNRGWKSRSLEGGDARGEPNEWYDGYMDAACGRAKWHRPLCPDHGNHEGGCGQA